jgi:hypothetical protein
MLYFGYPLGIHGWKSKPETEPDKFRVSEPENHGRKIKPEPETARPETRGYPLQTRPAAVFIPRCLKNSFYSGNGCEPSQKDLTDLNLHK